VTDADGGAVVGHLWLVGAGRLGVALAAALADVGAVRRVTLSGRAAEPAHRSLLIESPGRLRYSPLDAPAPEADAVIVAVPDAGIAGVAERVAAAGLPAPVPVLHTSGALGVEVLEACARRGHPVGSLHPLAAVAPGAAGAAQLRGAWWAVSGEGAARALGERLVAMLEGRVLAVPEGGKPLYHAAAVFASNYVVALLGTAESLLERSGVPAADARAAAASLALGAVRNVEEQGPAAALTGPVARGDADTVSLHLARLSGEERALYSVLARRALALARGAGLPPERAEAIERLLGGEA
jgi:predicted short-subunit dehydrogenase-like oxidoreductase (DUF2520 family)